MADVVQEFEKYVNNSSWEDIAKMVKTYSLEFSKEDKEVKRVKKQMKLTKELLYEYLKGNEEEETVKKASFFRGLVRSITLLEKNLDKHSTKKAEFLIFLKALLLKIRKEKLVVFKTMERRNGFEKLKEAGDE